MKSILTILILTAGISISAQPVITNKIVNEVGDSIIYYTKSDFTTSDGGAGGTHTWDFSTVTGLTPATGKVYEADSTPDSMTFSSAIFAIEQLINSDEFEYYSYDNNKLEYWGSADVGGNPAYYEYINPQVVLQFPFSFTTSFTDNFTATYVFSPATWNRTGTTTVTGDGYGTLITPDTTFTNVLRVYTQTNYADSTGSFGFSYQEKVYSWYSTQYKGKLMEIRRKDQIVGSTIVDSTRTIKIVKVPLLTAVNKPTRQSAIKVAPNPTKSTLNISGLPVDGDQIEVYDIAGKSWRSMGAQAGQTSQSMDVSELPRGFYIIKVLDHKGRVISAEKVILQ